jgi:hypothetical protein
MNESYETPAAPAKKGPNWLLIGAIVVVVMCCCCAGLSFLAWEFGDAFVEMLM